MNSNKLAPSWEILPWQPAAFLRVTGSDGLQFLQGQFTNDLRELTRGAVYGLWLTVKGKVLGDSFVLAGNLPDEFWLGSYVTPAGVLRERLESYIIADDVVVDDETANWSGVGIWPVDGSELPAAPAGVLEFPGRRSRPANCEWVFRRERESEVRTTLAGARVLTAHDVEARRIRAGLPSVPVDIGPGELPNEGGLEADALSFTKGCYLGQEVMARLKSMGQVRRRLLRVQGAGGVCPAVGTALYVGERRVGELRSTAPDGAGGFIGLALVSLVNFDPAAALATSPGGAAELRIVDSP